MFLVQICINLIIFFSCFSYVGQVGIIAAQVISLPAECHTYATVLRELGHAIGFHHEQIRPDRDNYVQINYHNIDPGK